MSSTKGTTYKKRLATSGIQGQLYETKLISLLLFRLLHDERFEEFYLASNMDEIGGYDDVCFKAKLKGLDKQILVFLQAKHKDDDNTFLKFDTVHSVYDSYTKVIQKFYLNTKNKVKDKLINGKFEDHECVFILYTNGNYHGDSDIQFKTAYSDTLNDLLATGKVGMQLNCTTKLVEEVSETIRREEIATLAERFAKFLNDKSNQSMNIMLDDYMLRYHVILAKTVVDISEIHSEELKPDSKWRILKFRTEFFDTKDKYIHLLKIYLFKQIIQNQFHTRNSKPVEELNEQFRNFLNNPCAVTLSPLIGTHISYKNGKLEIISQTISHDLQEIEQIKLNPSVVEEAESITVKETLLSLEFKVPVTFGNLDLNINNRRIDHLTKNVIKLCNNANFNKVITLDETIEKGNLGINGGLAGTIGNLLVYDQHAKMYRFAENLTPLQNNARIILEKLNSSISNLHEYRFHIKSSLSFPKSSFDEFDYSDTAKEILNRIVIYAKQSNQNGVEDILKKLIEDQYSSDKSYSIRVKTDSVFQNYHNAVQTWWLTIKNVHYLTKTSKIYQQAINNIIIEPQMTSINNTFYITNMKNIDFTNESLESLQHLLMKDSITIIKTGYSTLTAIKVIQYLRHKGLGNFSVLDIECMFNMSTEDFCNLKAELNKTLKILLIVCTINNVPHQEKCLKEIMQVVQDKQKVFITNAEYAEIIKQMLDDKETYHNIISEKHSLIDLTLETRKNIMQKCKIIFQGDDTTLDVLINDIPAEFIEGVVLNKIFLNEPIKIGEPLDNPNYEKAKHLYVDREVEYGSFEPIIGRVKCGCSVSDIHNKNDTENINRTPRCICCTFPKILIKKTFVLKNDPEDSEKVILSNYISRNYFKELEKYVPQTSVDDSSTSGTPTAHENDNVDTSKRNTENNQGGLTNKDQNNESLNGFGESSNNDDNLNVNSETSTNEETKKEQDDAGESGSNYFIENFIHDFFNYSSDDVKKTELDNPIFFVNLSGYVQSSFLFSEEKNNDYFIHVFSFKCHLLQEYVSKGTEQVEFLLVDQTDEQYISNLFSIKRNQLENKIWCVEIQLHDRTGQFNRWQKDKQLFRDTLKTLRYVCHCIVLNYICRNETITITKTFGCQDTGPDVDYFTIHKNAKSVDLTTSDETQSNLHDVSAKEEYCRKVILNYFANDSSNLIANIVVASNCVQNATEDITLDNTQVFASSDCFTSSGQACHHTNSEEKFRVNFFINLFRKKRFILKTFHDVKDDVVLLTARPGMGKSILLTHLSLKTKELDKGTWIIRVNLLDHSAVFSQWEQNKDTVIDTLSTLKLISQVLIKDKDIKIDLKESGDKVYLEYCSGDDWTRFLINIFLHFYNERRLILLCDGFDEICPHYKNEVVKFLRAIKSYPQKNKTWITSRLYNKITPDLNICTHENSHHVYAIKLTYLSKKEQLAYLTKFWDANSKLQKLCEENMRTILHCILNKNTNHRVIYYFFIYIESKYPLQETFKTEFKTHINRLKQAYGSPADTSDDLTMSEVDEFLGTPLLLQLTADYFVNRLLDLNTFNNKYHFNMVALYNQFVKTKLKSILFEDKCGVNTKMPFMMNQYELALKECMTLHKRLAAHTVFGSPLFKRNNLHEAVQKEIEDMSPFNFMDEDQKTEFNTIMELIRTGNEKTGLITKVTDENKPIFIHETFADYFATEYICDIMKSSKFEYEKKRVLWFLILATTRFYIAKKTLVKRINVTRSWLTEKIKIDDALRTIVLDIQSKPWNENDRYFRYINACRCPNKSCTKLLDIE